MFNSIQLYCYSYLVFVSSGTIKFFGRWAVDMIKTPIYFTTVDLPTSSPTASAKPSTSAQPSMKPTISSSDASTFSSQPSIDPTESAAITPPSTCSGRCLPGYDGLVPSTDCKGELSRTKLC